MHWLAPDSRSRTLHERARSHFAELRPPGATPPAYAAPWIAEARGAWLRDLDGRRCLDLSANDGTLLHGHAHPLINAAVADQLERGCCSSLASEPELALAELLCGRVPSFERIHLCASGDDALRALRGVLLRVTGRQGMLHVDDDPRGGADGICAAIDAAGPELAAVVVDPAPARHGFAARDSADLVAIESCARARGALVVQDERRSFRLGFAGAQGRLGASPDLTLLGAQIGGGWNAAALAGREQCMVPPEVADDLEPLEHLDHLEHSNRPDPLSMVAGHAALALLDLAAFEHLDAIGEAFRARMAAVLLDCPLPLPLPQTVTVTGIGSAFALRVTDAPEPSPGDRSEGIIDTLLRLLLAEGVLLNPDATGYLATTCGPAEIDHCAAALGRALTEIAARPRRQS